MSAYFENGVFTGGERAWHHQGIVVDDPWLTPAQVLTMVPELALTVDSRPVSYHGADGVTVSMPDVVANVRSDGRYLGAVSAEYQVVQPQQSFEVLDALTADKQLQIATAGTVRGGRTMWVLAYLPREIVIAGEDTERVIPFICFHNSYDGKRALTIGMGPTRVVCWNTVQTFDRSAPRLWTMRHTGNITEKLGEASKALGLANTYYDAFERIANDLIRQPFSVRDMRDLLGRMTTFKVPEQETDHAAANRVARTDAVVSFFQTSPNLQNVKGTRWAAYNAIAEWHDHEKVARKSKIGDDASQVRFRRNLLMPDLAVKDEAFALLTA